MKLPVDYRTLDWRKGEKKFVREEYQRIQNNLCCHCNADLDGPPSEDQAKLKITPRLYPKGFFNHPVHLHHDHNTGMTIGALHAHCNAVLWEYHHE